LRCLIGTDEHQDGGKGEDEDSVVKGKFYEGGEHRGKELGVRIDGAWSLFQITVE